MTLKNRYDFVFLFDVQDGNPNGDPDAGNLPRIDSETGCGLVTDVCLKRKVRNFIAQAKGEQPPFKIYIKEKAVLSQVREEAYPSEITSTPKEKGKNSNKYIETAQAWMCNNFYDIRTFGAVMSMKEANCGQVRGPVQMTFARSIDPIVTMEHSITRMAVETKAESENQNGDNRTMGRKYTIPYGLYRAHGFVSAHLSEKTGFSEEDLNLFWEALTKIFDHDHSAARGLMASRGLFVFKHESSLGNYPAHKLFEKIQITRKSTVKVPRHFSDYEIIIKTDDLPKDVQLIHHI